MEGLSSIKVTKVLEASGLRQLLDPICASIARISASAVSHGR
jgi:hypothetical protein